ncbi:MAG: CoA transferase subunit A [Oscillospiraceae bacterium]|nr:CoA transferase subunit A [Oscillospiraceae bacterium]
MLKSKVMSVEEAINKYCFSGMSILLPGFVNVGVPETLIDGLLETDITDLNVISNNTSVKGRGIGKLVHADRIKHLTCSHIGNNEETCAKVVAGEIDVTFVPQGSICEKVRAGGAGIGGILTPTGVHTPMEEGKQLIEWREDLGKYVFVEADEPEIGKRYILERPIRADVCFIHAWKVDKIGNCYFRHTARNFNNVFANAADHVIVEAEEIVEVGELLPDTIFTPHFVVDAVVLGKKPTDV